MYVSSSARVVNTVFFCQTAFTMLQLGLIFNSTVFRCRVVGNMPGRLKVRVVAGRHLPVMDRASDLTDAFVEVYWLQFCSFFDDK